MNDTTNLNDRQTPQLRVAEVNNRFLSVGDKLYRTNYSEISEVVVIERVTKTQAISKDDRYKFNIELSPSGSARKIGNTDRFSTSSFYIETEQLKEKLFRQNTVIKLCLFEYHKLSTEKLRELLSFLNGC